MSVKIDITERLRREAEQPTPPLSEAGWAWLKKVMRDAAEEIEQLRASTTPEKEGTE